jgi:hypothetical protein
MRSCAFKNKQSGELEQRTLQQGLKLEGTAKHFVKLRSHITGLEYLLRSEDLCRDGLYLELGAFKYQVLTDITELYDEDGLLEQLCQEHDLSLAGGIPSIADAKEDLIYAPLFTALDALLTDKPADDPETTDKQLQAAIQTFAELSLTTVPDLEAVSEEDIQSLFSDLPAGEKANYEALVPQVVPALALWQFLKDLSETANTDDDALAENLRLSRYLELRKGAITSGLFELMVAGHLASTAKNLLDSLQEETDLQSYLLVNEYEGVHYFNQERYRLLAVGFGFIDGSSADAEREDDSPLVTLFKAEMASGYQLERLTEQQQDAGVDEAAESDTASDTDVTETESETTRDKQ